MSSRTVRARKGRLLFTAGLLVAGATFAAVGSPASADSATPNGGVTTVAMRAAAPTPKDAASTRPTVVLVHGAWADGSSWYGVMDRLRKAGYPVVAEGNPLEGLAHDSATLESRLRSISGPIILVGHSYGGAVITNAAAGNPNVKALVYVAAFAPDAGESVGSLLTVPVAHPIEPTPLLTYPVENADGTTDTDTIIDPAQFRDVFAGDLNPTLAADMAASQRPTALSAVTGTVTSAAWHTIPSWYLVAKQDHAIAPDLERYMAKRLHAHTVESDGSHSVMVSHPDAITKLIQDADRGTR
jgi:pimeloyl-ACP methyl ester carboxylesterase